ncbi:hypothetical protein HNP55_003081 [Paucibacter oligotrophus]|uniref:Secreted protein with PEP-CTERM sorting signal n=1 Tax=Roseateles oligotrophus TaxID=1769250 RepID=A0A840LGY6_9BURK|nr:PEP-CTERM sorting domain-containing protein [Roseateles oligotrophus]MBB4844537.1 hypothetical protein [Roseateles oligotrophus]
MHPSRTPLTPLLGLLASLLAAPAMASTSVTLYGRGLDAQQTINFNDIKPGHTSSSGSADGHVTGPSAAGALSVSGYASAGHLAVSASSATQVYAHNHDSQGNLYERIATAGLSAEANASWQDRLTLNAAGLAGQRGYFEASLQLTGNVGAMVSGPSVNIRNPDGSSLYMQMSSTASVVVAGTGLNWTTQSWDDACTAVGMAGHLACAAASSDPGSNRNYQAGAITALPIRVDFIFGNATTMAYHLRSFSSANATIAYYKMAGSGQSAGTADMSHTLLWGGMSGVYLQDGRAVGDYSLSADSGLNYGVAAVVPEPASGLLLLGGLALLAGLRRRH